MKRVFILAVAAAAAAALLAAGRASSDPVFSGQCGIKRQHTVWAEYGWPTMISIFAKPGTALAISTAGDGHSGDRYAAAVRRRGAATYAFDLKLNKKVGTPAAPTDPSTIQAAADAEYAKAVERTGCADPLMVENELNGGTTPTPWTATTAQYRANVLAFLQELAAKGAHPLLLVNKSPYTGSSDAVDWWRSVVEVADVVREVYLPATRIWPLGPILGNRLLRDSYRDAVTPFTTTLGIPANRVGIMISFLSHKGVGGRNGLEPASAWYQVVKWEALAAKEVARETGLGSIFSWGWQEWNKREMDPDKPKAACVWLWARTRRLCNAPRMLGKTFDRSITDGQIRLAHSTICRIEGVGSIGARSVAALQALTGDRNAALSALFERVVESSERPVSRQAVLRAESEVVRSSFHGSRGAYVAALRQAHATVGLARAVLADELRRARLELPRYARKPSGAEVAGFYSSYPDLLVRRVHVSPAPPWLATQTGYALSESAPQRLFTLPAGRKSRVSTLLGRFTVRPLGSAQPLGALPLPEVRPAIAAALRGFERAQSFERWTIAQQNHALNRTICLRDQLPQPAAIDLTEYLPFLRIE